MDLTLLITGAMVISGILLVGFIVYETITEKKKRDIEEQKMLEEIERKINQYKKR
jgi:hypothetical protein